MAYGLIVINFIPATPSHARFLTDSERDAAIHRMGLDAHGATQTSKVESEKFSWHWVSTSSTVAKLKLTCVGPDGNSECQYYLTKPEFLRHYHTVS